MLLLVMKRVHRVHKHMLLLLQHLQHKLVVSSLFFLLKLKLPLIIKYLISDLFLFVSNFFPSQFECRIAISNSAFSCKNFSISDQVFLRFDVECLSSFSIDFRFIVSPKVSNDFLRMFSAFAASYSVFSSAFHWRLRVFFELLQIAL